MNYEIVPITAELRTPEQEILRLLGEVERAARTCTATECGDQINEKLLARMWGDKHASVFYHCHISFVLQIPVLLARQVLRHQVGTPDTDYTEMSLRYVNPAKRGGFRFHMPLAARDIPVRCYFWNNHFESVCAEYEGAVDLGAKPEEARGVLGALVSTTIYKTFSLPALAKFIKERSHKSAQPEAQELARLMLEPLPAIVKRLILGQKGEER